MRPTLASVANFSGGPHYDYRLGLPHAGQWNEVLNTDAECYGGSGVGNLGSVQAEALPWHGQPYSALLTVPPLGAVWLEPAGQMEPPEPPIAATAFAITNTPSTPETANNAPPTTEAGTVEAVTVEAVTVEPGTVTT